MHCDLLLVLLLALLQVTSTHAQYFVLTGVHTGRLNGTRPSRRNIYDLQQNDVPTFDLYLLGLSRMQSTAQSDPASWQQIAGIHGRPYAPWNGFTNTRGAPQIGYCPHSSPLFATWHRPYLALIEQVLASHVQAIAKQYPAAQQATYQAAADNFRLPYWDWGWHPDIPPVATVPNIQVTSPTGRVTIRNPLYSYRFPALDNSLYPRNQDSGLSTYPETVRQAISTINSRLRSEDFQRRTWTSIARSRTFNTFSTSSTPGTSIEAVHNSIHGDINAHMGSLSYSAFDPIFWLHHTNVDRLTALYQCINPNLWLTTSPEPQGTYTIPQFQVVAGSTPLTPFTSSTSGTLYTSDSSRSLANFGYTYPEIIDWNQSPSQLQASCTASLNQLYNPNGWYFKKRKRSSMRRRGESFTDAASEDAPIPAILESIAKSQPLRTWTVSIKVSKLEYPSSFVVRVFVGEPKSEAQDWYKDRNIIGSLFIQPPVGDASTFFKQQGRDVVVHDEFDLERGLWANEQDGQDVETTKAFLSKALTWRLQTPDGAVISVKQIKSLKISVAEELVTLAKTITELPKYSDRVLHSDITKGKLGGWQGTAAGKV